MFACAGCAVYENNPDKSLSPLVDTAGVLSSKSINDIPCEEPEPAASSSGMGLDANEKSPFLKASYRVRTVLI
jgi:hypothetical protein